MAEKLESLFFEKGLMYLQVGEGVISKISYEKESRELSFEVENECFGVGMQKVANAELKEHKSWAAGTIELHLPDFCRVRNYLIEKVEGDFSIPIGEALLGKTEADLLEIFARSGYYATRNDALNALPRDIIIRIAEQVRWDAKAYEEEGYEVVSMAPVKDACLMVHLKRR